MKTKVKILSFFIGGLLLMAAGLAPESSFVELLSNKLKEYTQSVPSEKVYLHFDKPYYAAGDDVWFKAYLLDAYKNTPSLKSEILYVDIINSKGAKEHMISLKVKNGFASGDFQLPSYKMNEVYKVRAYTHCMKNFGENAYFIKELPVGLSHSRNFELEMIADKEIYQSGDKVKLRFSVLNGKKEKVEQKISYKILDITDTIFSGTFNSVEDGFATIDFTLPSTIDAGYIMVECNIDRPLYNEKTYKYIKVKHEKIDFQLFPEGGELVHSVKSNVAFKAINSNGIPVNVKGRIVDENNKTITKFSALHDGMGKFSITPDETKKYSVLLATPSGKEIAYEFPEIKNVGYSLQLTSQNAKKVSFSIFAPEKKEMHLVGYNNGNLVFSKLISAIKGENEAEITLNEEIKGVIRVTLFDNNYEPHCERLFFRSPDKSQDILVEVNKEDFEKREKVGIKVKTKSDGKPAASNLSVSVYKYNSGGTDGMNICNYLLLSSELKGNIYQPGFYFSDTLQDVKEKALDLLMLTHGWRKFSWKEVVDNKKQAYMPEKASTISGRVVNRFNMPVKNPILFVSKTTSTRQHTYNGNSDGTFQINAYNTGVPIVVKAENWYSYGNNWKIDLVENRHVNTVSANLLKWTRSIDNFNNGGEKMFGRATSEMEIPVETLNVEMSQVVFIEAAIKIAYRDVIPANDIGSKAVLKELIENTQMPDLSSAMAGKAAGVNVTKSSGAPGSKSIIRIRGITSINNCDPLWVVDGVPVEEEPMLAPEDIENIVILKDASSTAIYGNRGANGVVEVTTKRGFSIADYKDEEYVVKTNAITIQPERNFTKCREFYSPNYENVYETTGGKDYRTTLFWTPELLTNVNGEAYLSFFTSDMEGSYRVVMEGLLDDGTPVYNDEIIINVK